MHHRRRTSTTSLIHRYSRAAAPMGVTTLDAAIPQSTGPTTLEAMASVLARPRRSAAVKCPSGKHLVISTRGARAGTAVCRGAKKPSKSKSKKPSKKKPSKKKPSKSSKRK